MTGRGILEGRGCPLNGHGKNRWCHPGGPGGGICGARRRAAFTRRVQLMRHTRQQTHSLPTHRQAGYSPLAGPHTYPNRWWPVPPGAVASVMGRAQVIQCPESAMRSRDYVIHARPQRMTATKPPPEWAFCTEAQPADRPWIADDPQQPLALTTRRLLVGAVVTVRHELHRDPSGLRLGRMRVVPRSVLAIPRATTRGAVLHPPRSTQRTS